MASHFYIRHSSIVVFNELLKPHMNEADILAMISQSAGALRMLRCMRFAASFWFGASPT